MFSHQWLRLGSRTSCPASLSLSCHEGHPSDLKSTEKNQGLTLFCIREVKSAVDVLEESKGNGKTTVDQTP